MIDPQTVANEIRERVTDSDAVRRLDIEVLSAAGTAEALTLKARHRHRVMTLTRTGGWWRQPAVGVAEGVTQELVAEVLSPEPGESTLRVVAGNGRPETGLRLPESAD